MSGPTTPPPAPPAVRATPPVPTAPRALAAVERGAEVVLTGIDVPHEHRLRLAELGLRPGMRLRVLARTVGGGRIVGVGPARLAIDRFLAAGLAVELAPVQPA